jgi:asparagine synthase (glutamine-hydrolysing)
MCGIAGIVGSKDAQLRPRLERMLAALRHRGPDGEGMEVDDSAAFGHRRLSIIDLEGGRQPLVSADRQLWLVCNGEIYNYQELRLDLQSRGYKFSTHSDSEVILGLYEFYGDGLLEHLRGMFAFALWDGRRKRLFAARDHLGQKPLYYANTANGFAFASEIKALLAFEPSLRELNLSALDQYLALRLIAPPQSMFRRIHKLPPAHSLTLQAGGVPVISRYWNLSYQPKWTQRHQTLLDELDHRVEESLRVHLVSDVRLGAFLSGGLDSGLLVAMLARRVGVTGLPTFTIGLPHGAYDEAPYARRVAQLSGSEHHEETLKPSLISLLPRLVRHLDEPSDPLSLCTYQLAALASRFVKVAIGGDGGDELFGGYDRYYGNELAGWYARVPEIVRRRLLKPALTLVPETGWYKSVGHQLRWLQQLSFLAGGERYAASLSYFYFDHTSRMGLFTPEALRELGAARAEEAIQGPYAEARGDILDRMLYADSAVRLPDHPTMITDRMSMAHGLETRSPFMDHRLAEFAARLPSAMKVRGTSLRIAQRQLASRYLPRDVLRRPKQGFSSALPYMLRGEYELLYDRLLPDSHLVRTGILRREPINYILAAHLAGKADHGNRLWLLINAEVWYRMMIDGVTDEGVSDLLEGPRSAAAA